MYRLDLLSKDEISGEKPCEKQSFFCMKLYVKYHVFILGIRNPADNSIIIDQNLLNIKITWEIADIGAIV